MSVFVAQWLIDSTRRGHTTSGNGRILISTIPVFALALLKPAQKEQGVSN